MLFVVILGVSTKIVNPKIPLAKIMEIGRIVKGWGSY